MTRYDVVIAGGGMVGAAIACALADGPLRIAVVEKHAPQTELPPPFDLRVSALTLASRNLLVNLGAWARIATRAHPIREMRVWEARGAIRFDAADIGEPCLGFLVENAVILDALLARLRERENVTLLCPAEIGEIRFDADAAEVRLSSGAALTTRLLIGADGARSAVRGLAGIGERRVDYGQVAIVATVTTAGRNGGVAFQRFLATGPLAFLPLDDHHSSIVWSIDSAQAPALLALDDGAFLRELHTVFGDALGELVAVSPRLGFPLAAAHADTYVQPRLALIGDAAHRVHPLAGYGLNLGFADAAVLAAVLDDAQAAHRDIGSLRVLRRYERWRKGDNLLMLGVTDGINRLFRATPGPVAALRNLGLDLVDAAAPLKHRLMRHAAGLLGDLPPLLKEGP